uniref:ZP domain-containing protein n=1 Tax=Anabas testudineus TaxID=64144 RepID=A0A3Q1IY74_ANATE
MRRFIGVGLLLLLMAVVSIDAQNESSLKISSTCLGNIMRVDVGPLGGKLLEFAAVMNNSAILITPSLASQCGFSMKTDHLGNAMIYASLQNCFAQNVEDHAFTTTLNLRLHGNQMDEDELYQVAETCQYTAWASREIVCDHNYMEASECSRPLRGRVPKRPVEAGFRITTLVFFTPEERIMEVKEALNRGYGIANTPSRLVLRSPKTTPETYIQNVAGVPMTVLKTSTIFEKKWLAVQIDATAACPLVEGSVSVSSNTIAWYLPWHIDPLISSKQFKLLEVHMGINGQRITTAEMAARQYSLIVSSTHIVIKIPIGAVGGYLKSNVQDNQYFTSYTVEPMVELHWIEDTTHEDTRYKVLFPITTPFLPQPLQVIDETVPNKQIFKLILGPFGTDVALINITFPSEVLSVAECNVRGFNVMELMSPNSSSKVFILQVPFMDPVVLQMTQNGFTLYRLQLTFGLLVLPELAPLSHTAHLEAKLVNIVFGGCDHQNFYVLVEHGRRSFQTMVGKQMLTPDLGQKYGFMDNGTHFSLVVPFSAPDVVFEQASIRGRIDVIMRNPETNTEIKKFSMACNFHSTLTVCFPNGTMTALAVKLEAVPSLNTSRLTLRDPTCGPLFSNDRFAYFIFSGNTCGTTRKFLSNVMLYENEISLNLCMSAYLQTQRVSCYYDINTIHTLAFRTKPLMNQPYAENGKGELQVAMRLALDKSYSLFYREEDYPISKYLQQPLYFEVELMRSRNPKVSLELENCWATLKEDRMSQPRWNLIIDGCANKVHPYQVVFHPVWVDARVENPSHFKRFEVQMFSFDDKETLSPQLFVHCDAVICDARNPLGGVCNKKCPSKNNEIRGLTCMGITIMHEIVGFTTPLEHLFPPANDIIQPLCLTSLKQLLPHKSC